MGIGPEAVENLSLYSAIGEAESRLTSFQNTNCITQTCYAIVMAWQNRAVIDTLPAKQPEREIVPSELYGEKSCYPNSRG